MAAGETLQHSMKNRCSKPVTLRLPRYIFLTSLQTIDKNQRNTRKKKRGKTVYLWVISEVEYIFVYFKAT